MKINTVQPAGTSTLSGKPSGAGSPKEGGTSFDEMLGRASSPGALTSNSAPAATGGINPLGEIRAPMPIFAEPPSSATADKTSALLNVLETYAEKMGSGETPLKEIESIVGEMGILAGELTASLNGESDPMLIELAEQSATLAAVESVKFRRGDYL